MPSIIECSNDNIFISSCEKDNNYDGWIAEFVDQVKSELKSTYPNRYYAD
jgi:hypothetical protein